MTKPVNQRGGKREGAGPKPRHPSTHKVKLTIALAPDLHTYIKSLPPGSCEKILREHFVQSLIVSTTPAL